jgi:hypothetical protein
MVGVHRFASRQPAPGASAKDVNSSTFKSLSRRRALKDSTISSARASQARCRRCRWSRAGTSRSGRQRSAPGRCPARRFDRAPRSTLRCSSTQIVPSALIALDLDRQRLAGVARPRNLGPRLHRTQPNSLELTRSIEPDSALQKASSATHIRRSKVRVLPAPSIRGVAEPSHGDGMGESEVITAYLAH